MLMKSEFVNLPAQSYYQISFGGEKPLIRHMPKFYSGNGYALFLFFIDRIRIEDLMGQTLYLSGVNFISEERAEITSGAIQNKKSQI